MRYRGSVGELVQLEDCVESTELDSINDTHVFGNQVAERSTRNIGIPDLAVQARTSELPGRQGLFSGDRD